MAKPLSSKDKARKFHNAVAANKIPRPREILPVHTLGLCETRRNVMQAWTTCAAPKPVDQIVQLTRQVDPAAKPGDVKKAANKLMQDGYIQRDADKLYQPTRNLGRKTVQEMQQMQAQTCDTAQLS